MLSWTLLCEPECGTGDTSEARRREIEAMVRHLHHLVVDGLRDREAVRAMTIHGYDEIRWAEGQQLLAELVHSEPYDLSVLSRARGWYEETCRAAREALGDAPLLLARLGLREH